MNRIHGAAVIGLTSLLSACCLWVPQHPLAPVDVLNPEHAFA